MQVAVLDLKGDRTLFLILVLKNHTHLAAQGEFRCVESSSSSPCFVYTYRVLKTHYHKA